MCVRSISVDGFKIKKYVMKKQFKENGKKVEGGQISDSERRSEAGV